MIELDHINAEDAGDGQGVSPAVHFRLEVHRRRKNEAVGENQYEIVRNEKNSYMVREMTGQRFQSSSAGLED